MQKCSSLKYKDLSLVLRHLSSPKNITDPQCVAQPSAFFRSAILEEVDQAKAKPKPFALHLEVVNLGQHPQPNVKELALSISYSASKFGLSIMLRQFLFAHRDSEVSILGGIQNLAGDSSVQSDQVNTVLS